jgi:hypothetical protein
LIAAYFHLGNDSRTIIQSVLCRSAARAQVSGSRLKTCGQSCSLPAPFDGSVFPQYFHRFIDWQCLDRGPFPLVVVARNIEL